LLRIVACSAAIVRLHGRKVGISPRRSAKAGDTRRRYDTASGIATQSLAASLRGMSAPDPFTRVTGPAS
jgi:hypothetical protein